MTLLSSHVKRGGAFQGWSVHICRLFNQVLDDLEVTFLSCNIQRSVSCIFNRVSFSTLINYLWADRTSTVREVHVGIKLEQSLHCIHMAVLSCHVERSRAVGTHFVNHCALLAEQSDHIRVTVLGSHVQRAVALLYFIWVRVGYGRLLVLTKKLVSGLARRLSNNLTTSTWPFWAAT